MEKAFSESESKRPMAESFVWIATLKKPEQMQWAFPFLEFSMPVS